MHIERKEIVYLSEKEYDTLKDARDLVHAIYHDTASPEIEELTDIIEDKIDELLEDYIKEE